MRSAGNVSQQFCRGQEAKKSPPKSLGIWIVVSGMIA
jgi:hypothetical protein